MLYKKVQEYCMRNSISICAFEKMCGLGNGVVASWKDDKSKPTLATLLKIEDKTKIPISKWLKA